MEMFELDWVFRLLAAMCAGIIIGYERHYRAKEAGIRTHTMVALGSCLLILISKYGFRDIGIGISLVLFEYNQNLLLHQ